jgi:hypothetical protein
MIIGEELEELLHLLRREAADVVPVVNIAR